MLTEELIAYAAEQAGDLQLTDMVLGVGYTAVRFSPEHCGVCYTFREELGFSCGVLDRAGSYAGVQATDILQWAASKLPARASVGLAAINALLNRGYPEGENIGDAVSCSSEDTVGMIGFFCPLAAKFRNLAKDFYIFEKRPAPGPHIHAAEEMDALLPRCDIVVLSATTLANHTAERILSLCGKAREIIMVGASTPMAGPVLRRYGVTMLAGTEICDGDLAMRIVAQGGGGMDLGRAGRKTLLRI
ncbi:MAG: DUF364 domain-containing protein [Firmicutes bacterium]|nr:DUF364 domain-containing protein [Bacillota bacterium]